MAVDNSGRLDNDRSNSNGNRLVCLFSPPELMSD